MLKRLALKSLSAGTAGVLLASAPDLLLAQSVNEERAGLEEIIVTAQRREQSAQDVPISIAAFSSGQLSAVSVQVLPQIGQLVPGLQFQSVGAVSVPFLRGVGAATTSVGAESTVPLIVDGVYISAQGASLMALSNIESVEVDKGPQGTLFGRNATGGVIQVRTRRPSHESQLDLSAGYGNYQTFDGTLYGTAGLSETLAFDIAVAAKDQRNGFGTNLYNGADVFKSYNYTVRSKWLWTPTDSSEVTAIVDYDRLFNQVGFATRLPMRGELGLDQRGEGGFQFVGGFYDVNENFEGFNITKTFGGSVDWLQRWGFANLRSITAYHRQEWTGHVDFDLTPYNGSHQIYEPTEKTFSEELQLLSKEDAWATWVLGAYLYRDEAGYEPELIDYPQPNPINLNDTTIRSNQKTSSWSAFGETVLPVSHATRLTLGVRFTSDDRDFVLAQTAPAAPPASITQVGRKTFTKFTYRAALDYRFADAILGYVQTSRGFKSGFFNTQALQSATGQPQIPLSVNPETLDAYEVGIKSDVLSHRLRANLAAFYYDYKDQQANAFLGTSRVLINAAASEIYGVDFELTGLPTRDLTVTFVGSYLHARYSKFPNAPLFTPVPGPGIGNSVTPANAAGKDLVNAPTFSGTLTVNYSLPVGAQKLDLNANAYYNDGYFFDYLNTRRQDAYTLLNASVKWTFGEHGNYGVSIWGANLLGKEVYAAVSQIGRGPAGLFGGDALTPREPRTCGVRVSARF